MTATALELTTQIVASYVANNQVQAEQVPAIIHSVYVALNTVETAAAAPAPREPLKPAVPLAKSVTADFIICLEDGKKFKSLKRHLRTAYNMTPEEYRAKWARSLPDGSPELFGKALTASEGQRPWPQSDEEGSIDMSQIRKANVEPACCSEMTP
ncbi:MAG: mucR [Devosia sp.]|jgi:predicted transcriptional regulator|nr:mucR [Devosia sp.]